MNDGFDIIIYLIPLAIWVFSIYQQFQKKGKKRKVSMPKNVTIGQYQNVEETIERVEKEIQFQENEIKKKRTFLGKNPYAESIEYRKEKEKNVRKGVKTRKTVTENDFSEIDWKKAVIYSEILRPRF